MRVLYFSKGYTPHDHRFLESLSKTEHEVFFLQMQESRGLERRPIPQGVQSLAWSKLRDKVRWYEIPSVVLELRRILGRIQPDLVHAGPVQESAFVTALAGFHPLVTMSWGSDLLLRAQRGLDRLAARFTLARSDVFVCDCRAVRNAAVELGMTENRIVEFPWGVDLNLFSPGDDAGLRAQLHWEDAFVVLSTRSWEPLYGLEVLVEGFIQAAAEESSLRLLLLGRGSMRDWVVEALRAQGCAGRVEMPGQVSYEELPRYYRAADLYASASISDGSSVSLMEALACGRPALVSNIPSNREWVQAEETGWFFEKGDSRQFADRLLEAVQASDRLAPMGRAARRLAEKRANWQRNFLELLRAYDMAVALRSPEAEHA